MIDERFAQIDLSVAGAIIGGFECRRGGKDNAAALGTLVADRRLSGAEIDEIRACNGNLRGDTRDGAEPSGEVKPEAHTCLPMSGGRTANEMLNLRSAPRPAHAFVATTGQSVHLSTYGWLQAAV